MKCIFHTVFLLLFAVLQPTWHEKLAFFGIIPNLFLIYLVVVCCFCKRKEGVILGFVFGLVFDLLQGRIIGLSAILMMILAFYITYFFSSVIRNNTIFITLLIVLISVILYELFYYVIVFLGDLHLRTVFVKVLLPECLCSSIVAVPIYLIIKKFTKVFWDNIGETIG